MGDEAEDLFNLVDIDGSGSIDPEEFVNGCIRLQGPAKALDLASFMHEYKQAQKRELARDNKMHRAMASLQRALMNKGHGIAADEERDISASSCTKPMQLPETE